MIERDELCALIPHAEGMCLLDKVQYWDQSSVECYSNSHLLPHNPLRTHNQLAAVHAIEYAAQAMAVHGSILAREQGIQPVQGFIAALRNVRLHVGYIHDKPDSLYIRAEALLHNTNAMIYTFIVTAGEMPIADGRISVMTVDRF